MRYLLSLVVLMILISCVKEPITNYYAYWKNNTTHTIEVKPFSNGFIVSENAVTLMPNSTTKVAEGSDRGISDNGGFSSKHLNADSIHVVFDNTYTMTHYFVTPASLSSKYFLYS